MYVVQPTGTGNFEGKQSTNAKESLIQNSKLSYEGNESQIGYTHKEITR